MKVLLAVLLFAVVAQIPSCGGEEESGPIVGFVTDKYLAPGPAGGASHPVIVIQTTEYFVTWDFYREVRIGDLVKFENSHWIIVKKASQTSGFVDVRGGRRPPVRAAA